MLRRHLSIVLVCLAFCVQGFSANSLAQDLTPPAWPDNRAHFFAPSISHAAATPRTAQKMIQKCRPLHGVREQERSYGGMHEPVHGNDHHARWELMADVFFARTKGKVRFASQGLTTTGAFSDIDLNADMGLPDHQAMGSYSVSYMFKPRWALRFWLMPMMMEGSGQSGKTFVFGNNTFTAGQGITVNWERLVQRIGLRYEPIETQTARMGVFMDYVRTSDMLKVSQNGFMSQTMDNDSNMAMVGVEYEKFFKRTATGGKFSLACMAGVSFGEEGFCAEFEAGLKYTIPMNNGRHGFAGGGYRYQREKEKSSEARMFDVTMEGCFIQMGLVF